MNKRHILSILLVSSLVALSLPAVADDGSEDDNRQGGAIQGTETLNGRITLSATPNAPTGASGTAELEAENDNGAQTAKLSVQTRGLNPGDYTLSVVKKSDGTSQDLGQMTVGGSGSEGQQSDQGQFELQLPPEVDAMDIAQLVVSDASGNAVLVGDLLNPGPKSVLKLRASVQIQSGGAAPSAKGFARMQSITRQGIRANSFVMLASGVPANSLFELHLNGQKVGKVKSSSTGRVLISNLRGNLLRLHSVELMDAQGQSTAKADF